MVRGSEESEPSDNMASLLDRYDEIQRRPLGTNTALSAGNTNNLGGVAGSQFRRQEAAYGQALRTLNRAARRGDARAAMDAIDVRKEAMGAGFAPGGIRRSESANAGIRGQVAGLQQDTAERAKQSRILQMQTDESLRNLEERRGAAVTTGSTGTSGSTSTSTGGKTAGDMTEESMGTPEERRRIADELKRTEDQQTVSLGVSGGAAETPAPATGSRINRLTGRPFGYTPPTTPAPMEKTPAQKYAEAQEAYQKGFKTEDDTQDTRFAAMNRIYSGADSQGQADIVAQSLKRAAGLEKTATPAPTKRTSRINRRK